MRTPGRGERRFSSTRGVCPIAWTMSPYLPPHGRLSRRGSIIASKSVVLGFDPLQPGLRQTVLAYAGEHGVEICPGRSHLMRLLSNHLVGDCGRALAAAEHLNRAAPVGVAGRLLGVELAKAERQLPEDAP